MVAGFFSLPQPLPDSGSLSLSGPLWNCTLLGMRATRALPGSFKVVSSIYRSALDPARRQPNRNRHGAGHRYDGYLEIVYPVCSSWKRSSDKPQVLVIFPSLLNVRRKTRSTSKGSLETESV